MMRGQDGLAQVDTARCTGSFSVAATVIPGLAAATAAHDPMVSLGAQRIITFNAAQGEIGIRRVNTMTVSSFLGPQMTLYGLDDARRGPGFTPLWYSSGQVPVYSLDGVLAAGRELLARCPVEPGSFVPSACKETYAAPFCRAGAALGVGIPADEDAEQGALLMEAPFTSTVRYGVGEDQRQRESVVASVRDVSEQDGVQLREIWVAATSVEVPASHLGCGLVQCIYVDLPVPLVT
jgi:hypothetical protein